MRLLKSIRHHVWIIIVVIASAAECRAQSNAEYEFVPLVQNQKLYLNSQGRIGGTTRSPIHIQLPANTVQWVYMLTTKKAETPLSLDLLGQLTKIYDRTGFTSALISSLTYPSGESTVNAYLISAQQYSNFTSDRQFLHHAPGSRIAFNSGPVAINAPYCNGEFYIGLENPAAIAGVTIMFDAVAIVKKPKAQPASNAGGEQNSWQSLLENVGRNLTKPKDSAALRAEALRDSAARKEQQAANYGNLGWSAYERGDIDASIQYSLRSLSIYPTFIVKANLGLCYLIRGKEDSALDLYMSGLDLLPSESGRKSKLKGAIADIEAAKQKHPMPAVTDDVLKLLKSKL
ncbi:MAG: hypothetical protein EOO15_16695 [Chitinophagaceae bacterium]|nr:MAG: hypothetical protein EOO15_16695 [Chitinophagaceae bacterium]